MHFSLRKTFSLLNSHRRARSDVPEQVPKSPTPRLQSWSLTKIEELIFGSSTQVAPKPFYVNVANASVFQPPASSQRLVSPSNVTEIDTERSTFEQCMAALQIENKQLKEKIATLELDTRICEEELAKFRSDYYAERCKATVRRRRVSASEAKFQAKHDQLEQAEAFILSMIEIDLHQPVLSEAWQDVKRGCPADEALLRAIKKAAAIPGTSWSSIIPAVVRSQTHGTTTYPIPLTWKVRKEDLNTTVKAAMFWKSPTKADASPDKTATPSASNISPTGNDTADHKNQKVVDDLLGKPREGGHPARRPVNSKRGAQNSDSAPNYINRTTSRGQILAIKEPESSLNIVSRSATLPDPPSPDKVPQYIPTPPSHASDLAPLASQTFKDERVACSPRRLRLSLSNQGRTALGKIDINRSVQKLNSFRKVTGKQGAQPSAKALGKRKAIMVTGDMQLITPNLSPNKVDVSTTQSLPEKILHPTMQQSGDTPNILGAAWDIGSIPSPYDPAGPAQNAQPLCDLGTLLPERALLSLERICAGFSSGSLGSLAMVSEESKATYPGGVVRNSLPFLQSTPPIKPKQANSATRTPPIFRKSVLPVLKVRRVMSISSKSSLPAPSGPIIQGTVGAANTNTSPLRITKKTRPSAPELVLRKPHTMGPTSAESITRRFSGGRFSSKRVKPAQKATPIAF